MRDFLISLSKKRGQSKKATTDFVKLGMDICEKLNKFEKIKTFETLREIG